VFIQLSNAYVEGLEICIIYPSYSSVYNQFA